MANEQAKQLLQQGIAAAKAGQPAEARQLLQQAVRSDPSSEAAWLWLSSVAKDDQERIFCLKKLLEINPNNENAIKGLQQLGVGPEPRTPPARPASGIRKLNTPIPTPPPTAGPISGSISTRMPTPTPTPSEPPASDAPRRSQTIS